MTDSPADPGVLIGQGRAASVYALDDRRVLRRYAKPRSCAGEAELMRYLRQAGYPVPEVLAVDGRDLVLERLNGPDMLADLIRRPWRVLHLDLHPANVMLTPGGPVVIDWTNAAAGPAGADVALADLIMASSDIDGLPGWLRRIFLLGFRRAVRDDPGPYLAEAARYGSRMPTSVPMRPNGCGGSPASARRPAEVDARRPERLGSA